MYLDTTTVFAGSLGTAIAFGLFRLFLMWKRWSNASKENDEIDWDKKIADAIKQGDVETIARLRKYFLSYKRTVSMHPKGEKETDYQNEYEPNRVYLNKHGKFFFYFTPTGEIHVMKAVKYTMLSGKSGSALKLYKLGEDGVLRDEGRQAFRSPDELLCWLKSKYGFKA